MYSYGSEIIVYPDTADKQDLDDGDRPAAKIWRWWSRQSAADELKLMHHSVSRCRFSCAPLSD